jgi:hypothetical protein
MMKKALILSLFCFIFGKLISQEYRSSLGVKAGYPGVVGLNFKAPLTDKRVLALDNMIGTNFDTDNRFIAAQMLVQVNKRIGINSDFSWYYGAGPTIQHYVTGGYLAKDSMVGQEVGGTYLKLDFCIGLEKTQERGPFNIAFEIGPSLFLMPTFRLDFQFNIAVRYAFKG